MALVTSTSKRDRIVQEILDTEVSYIGNLELIIELFLNPIRETCLLPDDARATIFSNVEAILAVNRELLACMLEQSPGEAFARLAPFLRLYSLYANNFERANQTLAKWTKKSPEFARFRTEQESRPECLSLGLASLLIMPVQRVPRCKLLLDDLLKHTRDDDPEWAKLRGACRQIGQVTTHINEHIRTHENFRQMLRIQNSLTGTIAILAPGRKFIREGKLMKICKRKSKERMCFLFSDLFIYARPTAAENSTTYSCRSVLPLMFCTVTRIDDETDARAPGVSSFVQITCKDLTVRMFGKEIQPWVDDIRKAIEELRGQQITLLEQIRSRAGRDKCHRLRDRISRHLDSSMQKSEGLSRSRFNASEVRVETTPLLEEQEEANDIEENIQEKVDVSFVDSSGFCGWNCSPLIIGRTRTMTYDVQRQKVRSSICAIM
ncbi:rho guanine nucleotide exchange factor 39-like [Oscarella lobularis]|uniref:rho guanine nucleotide exchange factor 39-like n=1 Tax=Oscarella lobularis TaxID=121494 RepID=UPI003313B778